MNPKELAERLGLQLDTINRIITRWRDYDRNARNREGLVTTPDTHIIAPPTWPSHGQLQAWSDTFAQVQAALESTTRERDGLREAHERIVRDYLVNHTSKWALEQARSALALVGGFSAVGPNGPSPTLEPSSEAGEGEWRTVRADRVMYLDDGNEQVLCDRLPSPVTLVLKLASEGGA